MLFDTDVFIWVQRGNANAARMVDAAAERHVSVQTYMELLQGARDKREQKLNKDFLRDMGFAILPLTQNIGLRAAVYIEHYALSSGLRAGDAIVAATAVETGLPLATSNVKHFRAIAGLELHPLKP